MDEILLSEGKWHILACTQLISLPSHAVDRKGPVPHAVPRTVPWQCL